MLSSKELRQLPQELRELAKACEAQNFEVTVTRRGHLLVRNHQGKAVTTVSCRVRNGTSHPNGLAPLKRAGLLWPPPGR